MQCVKYDKVPGLQGVEGLGKNSVFIDNLAIAPEGLLWAQPEISEAVGDENRRGLYQAEIHDWLSSIYWLEGVAAKYALRMQSLAPAKRKATWGRVYRDEVDHQLRIGRWLLDKGMPPLAPNAAVQFASQAVESINASLSPSALAEKIADSQLFFEEYTSRLLKWRLPYVLDRDLKAALYRISKDELFHIALGCAETQDIVEKKPDLNALIRSRIKLAFPFHLAKRFIKASQLRTVREKVPAIIERIFFGQIPSESTLPPIIKKWEGLPGYNCVACSPWHDSGLHLEPRLEAETGDAVDSLVFPLRMQGFNQITHGGFIAMALDEMLGYAVILSKGLLPVTKSLELTYLAPVSTEERHTVRTRVVSQDGQVFQCVGEIVDGEGRVKAKAKGDFFVPDERLGKKLFPALADNDRIKPMLFGADHASRSQ